jgi:hypothetical protein
LKTKIITDVMETHGREIVNPHFLFPAEDETVTWPKTQ